MKSFSLAGEEAAPPRIDVVERFGLKEVKIEKSTWGTYIKLYLKRISMQLEQEGSSRDRMEGFKESAAELAKFILSIYSRVTIYQGRSGDALAGYAYSYSQEVDG